METLPSPPTCLSPPVTPHQTCFVTTPPKALLQGCVISTSQASTNIHPQLIDKSLPPLNVLPTWNRPSLAKQNRTVPSNRKVTVQLVGTIENISRFTQTTPPSRHSSVLAPDNGSRATSSPKSEQDYENLIRQTFEKKLVFVQSSYESVLQGLHAELDRLKQENKELKFKLVISNKNVAPDSGISINENKLSPTDDFPSQYSTDSLLSPDSSNRAEKLEEVRSLLLEEEVRELRKSLENAKKEQLYLSQLLDQRELRHPPTQYVSANYHQPQKSQPQKHMPGNFGHFPGTQFSSRRTTVADIQPALNAHYQQQQEESNFEPELAASREKSNRKLEPLSADRSDVNRNTSDEKGMSEIEHVRSAHSAWRQKEKDEYENAINDLKQITLKQRHELNLMKEKLQQQKARQKAKDDLVLPKLEVLPANPNKSHLRPSPRVNDLVLPPLKAPVVNKMSLRQRKANATHMQRQRSHNQSSHLPHHKFF